MQRVFYLIILVIYIGINSITAQKNTDLLPENKYNDNSDSKYKKVCNYLNLKKVGLNILSRNNSFTNSNFASNISNGALQYTGFATDYGFSKGIEIAGRINVAPLLIDIAYMSDLYNLKTYRSDSYVHNGLKLSISTLIFPLTKYLLPYGGIGYQLSKISMTHYTTGSSTTSTASTNTSSPFWKIGCQSYLFNHFPIITVEYSQTFLITNKSSNQILFGIGYSL
jgi:hypothetical protein